MLKSNLSLVVLFIITFICFNLSVADNLPKSKVLKCAVCRSLVFEIQKAIKEVDPRKTVEVGSFRIGPDGKQNRSTKKYAGSETHMADLLESVCKEFDDYAQARHKETNQVEAIKLVVDGKMNPRFSEYEILQDPELNKGVGFHCESIVEDYEEDIITYFSTNVDTEVEVAKEVFCGDKTDICVGQKEEL